MRIYLAHPITGLSSKEVFDYYDGIVERLSKHTCLSPMTGKDYLRNETTMGSNYENYPISRQHAIYERDMWMVKSSDVVFLDLRGTKNVSIGCMAELFTAAACGRHTVVVMEDGNIHSHRFVNEATDIMFTDFEDAINYLNQLP